MSDATRDTRRKTLSDNHVYHYDARRCRAMIRAKMRVSEREARARCLLMRAGEDGLYERRWLCKCYRRFTIYDPRVY